ncbi:replication-relaxation family protein [Micromonospora sp. NPDC049240]|uniref:replication-relaxation family protein n=1 Tax=Micromonospora sp. NPDC049240 TaxID=3155151 RepID=UPI0033D366B0
MTTTYHPQFTVPSTRPIPAELLLTESERLRLPDWWAVEMLAEHRVLTTAQLTALGFATTTASATRRLALLARRSWIDRLVNTGAATTADTWWCLGPIGAQLTPLPEDRDVTPAQVYRARDRLRESRDLPGLLEANDFFVDLATRALTEPGSDLRTWWSPRTCRYVTGTRHVAWHGEYIHERYRHAFWYQPDPGQIRPTDLADRGHTYRRLTEHTGLANLLFHAADPQCEQELGRHLERRNTRHLTVVTSNPEHGHPAGPILQPTGETHHLTLTDLPHTPEQWPPDTLTFKEVRPRAPHPIYDPERPVTASSPHARDQGGWHVQPCFPDSDCRPPVARPLRLRGASTSHPLARAASEQQTLITPHREPHQRHRPDSHPPSPHRHAEAAVPGASAVSADLRSTVRLDPDPPPDPPRPLTAQVSPAVRSLAPFQTDPPVSGLSPGVCAHG